MKSYIEKGKEKEELSEDSKSYEGRPNSSMSWVLEASWTSLLKLVARSTIDGLPMRKESRLLCLYRCQMRFV